MASVVFDASAILALLRDEPDTDIVASHMGNGIISAANFQEVIKELLRRGISMEAALELLDALHLDIHPHGPQDAIAAASMYLATKQYGSGLGDRTCMALAMTQGLPTLTADHAWGKIVVAGLTIQIIR